MLYLVRHGEAQSAGPDSQRALTDRGIQGVERVAVWAARANLAVAEIRHSGKRRAEQTAELIAAHLSPAPRVIAVDGIAPNDDPRAFARTLDGANVMIVSHLPFLGDLVGALTDSYGAYIAFRPATLVALAPVEDGFVVEAVVHPDVLP